MNRPAYAGGQAFAKLSCRLKPIRIALEGSNSASMERAVKASKQLPGNVSPGDANEVSPEGPLLCDQYSSSSSSMQS